MKFFLFLLTALCIVSCDMPESEKSADGTNVGKEVSITKGGASAGALDLLDDVAEAKPEKATAKDDGIKRGTFIYIADAATFTECETGKKFPVEGAAYLAMERAYLQARTKDFQEIYTEIKGDYEMRDGMDTGTKEMTLVVQEMLTMDAAKSCE